MGSVPTTSEARFTFEAVTLLAPFPCSTPVNDDVRNVPFRRTMLPELPIVVFEVPVALMFTGPFRNVPLLLIPPMVVPEEVLVLIVIVPDMSVAPPEVKPALRCACPLTFIGPATVVVLLALPIVLAEL